MINWENINYIFQIPLSWYKKIHDKVCNAYGENFIRVKQDGENGGIKIGIDEDNFSQAVLEIAGGGSGGGTVKSVDDIPPDANGNVPLDAVKSVDGVEPTTDGNVDLGAVKSVNDNLPDENGNVTVSFPHGAVDSVDHISPDQYGNVQLNAIRTINGHNGDSVGNFDGVVMKVNDTTPDENGNVTIERGVTSVNDNTADPDGNVELNLGVLTINDDPPDPNGNIDIPLNFVKTINGESPDPNGNIDIDEHEGVKTVNNIEPDPNGNVNVGTVRSVNNNRPDSSGNVTIINDSYTKAQIDTKLNGYVTLNTEQSISGRKLFSADKLLVKTTGNTGDPSSYGYFRMATLDGNVKGYMVSGSSNGANSLTAVRAVARNVYTGVNVATDGVTHQQTLENEPEADTTSQTSHQIASRGWTNKYFWRKNDNATGVLYAQNGTLSYKTDFVQEDDLDDYALANDVYTKTAVDNKLTSYALASNVYTKTEVDNKLGSYVTTNTEQDIIATKRMKNNKNFLFYSNWEYDTGTHYSNAFEFFTNAGKRMARLIFGQQANTHNQVWLRSYGSDSQYSGVQMDVIMNGTEPEYRQLLDNEPARLYSTGQDNQIASRGYCRLNFSRVNHTHGDLYVTLDGDQVVNGQKTFSGQTTVAGLNVGSIQRAVQAMGNILIVGNANTTNNILFYPNNSMIRGTALPDNPPDQEIATVGWVNENGGKVKTINYEEPDPDGNIQLDIVTSVDGHGPNEDGEVSFNLAGNKFVKTDAQGHLTTSDTGGETVTKKVITNVTWNTSTNRFDIDSENWEFEDGLLKNITSNTQTHIATVTYTGT